MLNLRKIERQHFRVRCQQQRYFPTMRDTALVPNKRYLSFTLVSALERVEVMILLESWCQSRWTYLGYIAWGECPETLLIDLFEHEYPGRSLLGNTYSAENIKVINGCSDKRMWISGILDGLGDVLIASLPSIIKPSAAFFFQWQRLCQRVEWHLGESYIGRRLLENVRLHDVIRVQSINLFMAVYGKPLAIFSKQGGGEFMIDELINAEANELDAANKLEPDIVEGAGNFSAPKPKDVSIKLTFVLGHSEIPLSELMQLQVGTIYNISPNNEREVKLYAGRQLIAQGELVYIDENELGLEIMHIADAFKPES